MGSTVRLTNSGLIDTHHGSHTAISGGGERERVDMFRRTGKVADIKINVSSHIGRLLSDKEYF